MLEHATGTSASMDRVAYLDSAVNSAPEAGSTQRSSIARRSVWIGVSIALLSTAGVIIAALFYLNDPYWVKWGVGFVLAFNVLVAGRLLLSRRGVRASPD